MQEGQETFAGAWKELTRRGEPCRGAKGFTPVGVRKDVQEAGPLYHGTRAQLKAGDLLEPGHPSNYGGKKRGHFVYLTALKEGAALAAELAAGEGRPRVYVVQPTGPIEDDPNVTDQKFPGNPSRSYRTRQPLRVVGEVEDWTPLPPGGPGPNPGTPGGRRPARRGSHRPMSADALPSIRRRTRPAE